MAKLSVFPKGFMDELCVTKTMTLDDWIELAATLDVDGVEMYPGFFANFESNYLAGIKRHLDERHLAAPMMCASPDFTQPDQAAREQEIERERQMIDVTAALGGKLCRVLSGQRRAEISREDGVRWTVESITALLPYAAEKGVTLIMENHYKDGYWLYPEFAQSLDVFLDVIGRINSPHFGVNYDPSNAIIGGEDPLTVLDAVKDRIVSMHASDRYLASGTLEDVKAHAGTTGYSKHLKHGVIGQGLNDYDRIFATLRDCNFDGWISIEDGENGMDDLRASVAFLRDKMRQYFS